MDFTGARLTLAATAVAAALAAGGHALVSGAGASAPESGAARLLFRSGFEGNLRIKPPRACWGTGCWQDIDGRDNAARFDWPPRLLGGGGRFLMLTSPVRITPDSIGSYMFNRVEKVTGPAGTSTSALFQMISRNHNGTDPMGESPAQNQFQFLPRDEFRELYVSYWMKLQPDLVERMNGLKPGPGVRGGGTWRGIFAFKTGGRRPDGEPADNGDYRIEVYVFTYGGGKPYWGVIGDNNAGGNAPRRNGFSVENRNVPVPAGEWFKFEILWRRSAGEDGLVWVAIDGQTIARHQGPNLGAWEMPVNRIMAPLLYSGSSMPIYQWVDDLEVWSGLP